MKHLKSFNESNLPEGFRATTLLNKVTSGTEYYSDRDAQRQTLHYVSNIEKATGEEVVDAEGSANESDVDLVFKLSDGSEVMVWFGELSSWDSGFQRFSAPGTNDIMIVTYNGEKRNNRDYKFKKLSNELNDEYWENEVYYLLKDMIPEPDPEPTHVIKFPKESWNYDKFDNSTDFVYDQDSDGNDEVYFYSEEAAKKWLESLTIKIIEK